MCLMEYQHFVGIITIKLTSQQIIWMISHVSPRVFVSVDLKKRMQQYKSISSIGDLSNKVRCFNRIQIYGQKKAYGFYIQRQANCVYHIRGKIITSMWKMPKIHLIQVLLLLNLVLQTVSYKINSIFINIAISHCSLFQKYIHLDFLNTLPPNIDIVL